MDAVFWREASGSLSSLEGSRKREEIWEACSECGVLRARRFKGRLLRRSALVGMDSGPGSDILVFVEGGGFGWVGVVDVAAGKSARSWF